MTKTQKIMTVLDNSHVWLSVDDIAIMADIDRQDVVNRITTLFVSGEVIRSGNNVDGFVYAKA